eukprot:TRINITY_DN7408_c0_g1_i2.p1 TRINITY_DN7408_c0_g1~~TRINITY_DN7408_c0_g1_i2.p1  ORF type:complete len:167 (-),score=6.86 TRINITY_DN7408_c0_g1_i2:519-1019(-)
MERNGCLWHHPQGDRSLQHLSLFKGTSCVPQLSFMCKVILINVGAMLYTFKFPVNSSIVSSWIVKLLSWWLPLLSTIFHLPIVGIMLTVFDCTNDPEETYYVSIEEMNCFHGQHIIRVTFSIILTALTSSFDHFQDKYKEDITIAGNTSKIDTYFEVCLWYTGPGR